MEPSRVAQVGPGYVTNKSRTHQQALEEAREMDKAIYQMIGGLLTADMIQAEIADEHAYNALILFDLALQRYDIREAELRNPNRPPEREDLSRAEVAHLLRDIAINRRDIQVIKANINRVRDGFQERFAAQIHAQQFEFET